MCWTSFPFHVNHDGFSQALEWSWPDFAITADGPAVAHARLFGQVFVLSFCEVFNLGDMEFLDRLFVSSCSDTGRMITSVLMSICLLCPAWL